MTLKRNGRGPDVRFLPLMCMGAASTVDIRDIRDIRVEPSVDGSFPDISQEPSRMAGLKYSPSSIGNEENRSVFFNTLLPDGRL